MVLGDMLVTVTGATYCSAVPHFLSSAAAFVGILSHFIDLVHRPNVRVVSRFVETNSQKHENFQQKTLM
jgi:hypothetical protein